MDGPLEALKKLTYLAHALDDVSRSELLSRVTDVFMDAPGSFTEQQRGYFGSIMEKLAFDLERQVREELSRRVAAEPCAPRTLVKRLANDEISVAQPVLEQSPVLTQDDLVQLSEHSGQEHLLAITKRTDIGVRLSAVLVTRGRDEVVESLVRNDTARIATEDVQRVAARAEASEQLQSALIDRREVPREVMVGLLEHVSERLKDKLVDKLTDADKENLEDVLHTMRADIRGTQERESERYVEDLARRGLLDEQALLRFISDNRPMEFLLGFAKILNVDALTVQRIITDKTGQALAVACRANDFSLDTFKAIALSPVTGIASDVNEVVALLRVYQALKKGSAERAMAHWQQRKLDQRPKQDRRSEGCQTGTANAS